MKSSSTEYFPAGSMHVRFLQVALTSLGVETAANLAIVAARVDFAAVPAFEIGRIVELGRK